MKTQTQFYNEENGQEYFEQYFKTTTSEAITIDQYRATKEMLDDLMQLLSAGKIVTIHLDVAEDEE